MQTEERTALREAGFNDAQTHALAVALAPLATKKDLEPLATKEDLALLRNDFDLLRNDVWWMNWVGGAIAVLVWADIVNGFFL